MDSNDHSGAAVALAQLSNSLHAKAMDAHDTNAAVITDTVPKKETNTPTTPLHALPRLKSQDTPISLTNTSTTALSTPSRPINIPTPNSISTPQNIVALASPTTPFPAVNLQQQEPSRETGVSRTLQQDVRLLHVVCADLQSQIQRLHASITNVLQKQDEILTKLNQ